MTTRTREITPKSTMGEVLESYPSAKRALFQAYHIGGCHSCGYELTEALENVCASHGLEDLPEVIEFIKKSQEQDDKVQVSAREVAEMARNKVVFPAPLDPMRATASPRFTLRVTPQSTWTSP